MVSGSFAQTPPNEFAQLAARVTQWGFGPDPMKTTLRKHRFPVLHIVRSKSGATKFRHPVDVSSMFFTWDRWSQQEIPAV